MSCTVNRKTRRGTSTATRKRKHRTTYSHKRSAVAFERSSNARSCGRASAIPRSPRRPCLRASANASASIGIFSSSSGGARTAAQEPRHHIAERCRGGSSTPAFGRDQWRRGRELRMSTADPVEQSAAGGERHANRSPRPRRGVAVRRTDVSRMAVSALKFWRARAAVLSS